MPTPSAEFAIPATAADESHPRGGYETVIDSPHPRSCGATAGHRGARAERVVIIIVNDYRGHRIDVNAVAVGGRRRVALGEIDSMPIGLERLCGRAKISAKKVPSVTVKGSD